MLFYCSVAHCKVKSFLSKAARVTNFPNIQRQSKINKGVPLRAHFESKDTIVPDSIALVKLT